MNIISFREFPIGDSSLTIKTEEIDYNEQLRKAERIIINWTDIVISAQIIAINIELLFSFYYSSNKQEKELDLFKAKLNKEKIEAKNDCEELAKLKKKIYKLDEMSGNPKIEEFANKVDELIFELVNLQNKHDLLLKLIREREKIISILNKFFRNINTKEENDLKLNHYKIIPLLMNWKIKNLSYAALKYRFSDFFVKKKDLRQYLNILECEKDRRNTQQKLENEREKSIKRINDLYDVLSKSTEKAIGWYNFFIKAKNTKEIKFSVLRLNKLINSSFNLLYIKPGDTLPEASELELSNLIIEYNNIFAEIQKISLDFVNEDANSIILTLNGLIVYVEILDSNEKIKKLKNLNELLNEANFLKKAAASSENYDAIQKRIPIFNKNFKESYIEVLNM